MPRTPPFELPALPHLRRAVFKLPVGCDADGRNWIVHVDLMVEAGRIEMNLWTENTGAAAFQLKLRSEQAQAIGLALLALVPEVLDDGGRAT